MAHPYLDGVIASMEEHPQMRSVFKLAYPRRITPPTGFFNPKYYSPVVALSVFNAMTARQQEVDFVKSCIFMMSRKLIDLRMPTFFIGHEFAEAVNETRIESNMNSADLAWPDEAMLFCLPEKFTRQAFGIHVPFLTLVNYSLDEVKQMTNLKFTDAVTDQEVKTGPKDGHVFMGYQWLISNEDPCMDYVSSWPQHVSMAHVAGVIGTAPMKTTTEEARLIQNGVLPGVGMSDEQRERDIMNKMRDFSAKLLIAMTAEPHFIERGVITRKAKTKGSRQIDELWSPNTVGFRYSHPEAPSDGTHASPRLHRRIGHFRDQHYGPANASVKRLWIKPVWVGAKKP